MPVQITHVPQSSGAGSLTVIRKLQSKDYCLTAYRVVSQHLQPTHDLDPLSLGWLLVELYYAAPEKDAVIVKVWAKPGAMEFVRERATEKVQREVFLETSWTRIHQPMLSVVMNPEYVDSQGAPYLQVLIILTLPGANGKLRLCVCEHATEAEWAWVKYTVFPNK